MNVISRPVKQDQVLPNCPKRALVVTNSRLYRAHAQAFDRAMGRQMRVVVVIGLTLTHIHLYLHKKDL